MKHRRKTGIPMPRDKAPETRWANVRLQRLPARAAGLALLAFPLAVWLGHGRLPDRLLAALLLVLLAARFAAAAFLRRSRVLAAAATALAAAAAGCALLPWSGQVPIRYYPVVVSGGIAAVFLGSLATARPLVERIARLTEPALPPQGVAYCRRLTWFWAGLLAANAAAAFATARWGTLALWTLYNGLISYLILGAAGLGEYLLRRRLRARWSRA
jgi:uncharacterized membrane protein